MFGFARPFCGFLLAFCDYHDNNSDCSGQARAVENPVKDRKKYGVPGYLI